MNPTSFLGKVVAFYVAEKKDTCYGCVVGVDGGKLQIVEYAKGIEVSSLDTKRRHIAEEDAIIQSLQSKLKHLREKFDARGSGGSSSALEYTLLQLAKKRLQDIDRKDWFSIRGLKMLSESSRLVCGSVMAILRNADMPNDWKTVQNAISSISFVEDLCNIDDKPMREDLYRTILYRYVAHPLFSFESCTRESRVVGALQKWVTAFLDYQRARFFLADDIEIKQQIDACVNSIRKAETRRQELKSDIELFLLGRILQRTETVYNIPIASSIHVLDGVFSDVPPSLSQTARIRGACSSETSEHTDPSLSRGYENIPSQIVSVNGTLASKKSDEVAFLNMRCEELEKELRHCTTQNQRLQKEVEQLKNQVTTATKKQLGCECSQAEITSLMNEKIMLAQEISTLKENIKSEHEQGYQRELELKQRLSDVLQVARRLEEAHRIFTRDYGALDTVQAEMAECIKHQSGDLLRKQQEIDVLQKCLTVSRWKTLLAKAVVFLLRQEKIYEEMNGEQLESSRELVSNMTLSNRNETAESQLDG